MIPHEDLLIRVVIGNILFIWGFYLSCRVDFHDDEKPEHGYIKESRMAFWKLKRWSLKNLGMFWSKPVCTCPICMASLHSIIIYGLFCYSINWDWRYCLGWLLYVPSLGALNYFISLITNKLES